MDVEPLGIEQADDRGGFWAFGAGEPANPVAGGFLAGLNFKSALAEFAGGEGKGDAQFPTDAAADSDCRSEIEWGAIWMAR